MSFNSWVAASIALSLFFVQNSIAANDSSLPQLPFPPTCGSASSETSVNYNSGINLDTISTIYVFGDSLSANGNHEGGTPPPAVAGPGDTTTAGRATNGKMWNEVFLTRPGSKVSSFAIGGAVIDRSMYSALGASDSDFVHQVQTYLDQKFTIDAASSLTSVYFGKNDFGWASGTANPDEMLRLAAHKYLPLVKKLVKSGMKQFLILTPPVTDKALGEHNKIIWEGMLKLQKSDNIRFAHTRIDELWGEITSDPKAFNFIDTKACLVSPATLVGKCADPDRQPYWLPDHPSAQGQKFIAQYITQVLLRCGQQGPPSSKSTVFKTKLSY